MKTQLTIFALAGALLLVAPALASAQPRCEGAQVLLTVDRSSSMVETLPSGITQWEAARMAIGEVTAEYEAQIEFGLQRFPEPDRCAPGTVSLDIGPNTSDTILDALGGLPPDGGNYTPMAQTLDVAGEYGPLLNEERDNHLILITDGWQWCYPHDTSTRFDPVGAVERLAEKGITVHIVGFSSQVDALTLNRAAVAAGTHLPGCNSDSDEPGDPNNCYLHADDLDDLRDVLDGLGREITDEMCDGYDNDCDGMVDEGYDSDGDGYTTCGTRTDSPGETDDGLVDCDDTNPDVYPGAEEICDGLDNDCDGEVDPGCDCSEGDERDCGTEIGACMTGTQSCIDGGWGECEGGIAPAETDICDGLDEDCDGEVDEDADCGPGRACKDGSCTDLMPDEPAEDDLNEGHAPPSEEGGCGCIGAGAVRGGTTTPMALAGMLALLALVVVRRRR